MNTAATNEENLQAVVTGSVLQKYDTKLKEKMSSDIGKAVANADHLKRSIVKDLPAVDAADANTIYMLEKIGGSGEQKYDEYMLINGAFEKIGDSAVDLTDYATKAEVGTAKSEAVSAAASDATTKANTAETNAKSYADNLFGSFKEVSDNFINGLFK